MNSILLRSVKCAVNSGLGSLTQPLLPVSSVCVGLSVGVGNIVAVGIDVVLGGVISVDVWVGVAAARCVDGSAGVWVGVAAARCVDVGVDVWVGVAVVRSVDVGAGVWVGVAGTRCVDGGVGLGVTVGNLAAAALGDGVEAPVGMGLGVPVGTRVEVAGTEVGPEVRSRCVAVGSPSAVARTSTSTEAASFGLLSGDVGAGSATVHAANTTTALDTSKPHFEFTTLSLLRIPRYSLRKWLEPVDASNVGVRAWVI